MLRHVKNGSNSFNEVELSSVKMETIRKKNLWADVVLIDDYVYKIYLEVGYLPCLPDANLIFHFCIQNCLF